MASLDPGHLPALASERLSLRRPGQADVDPICALANNWEVTRWMGRLPFPYLRRDAVFFVEMVARQEAVWVVERRDGKVLGVVGLAPVEAPDALELGYWLGEPHWGRGYAREAAGRVLDYAFGVAGLAEIASGYFEGNCRSARVLRKLGFRQTGTSARSCMVQAAKLPHVDMSLAREAWMTSAGSA